MMGATKKKNAGGTRPGTATRARGKQRAQEILAAAQRVLVRDGYAQFSMRRIADEAGVRASNIQYYFPAKDDLVAALLRAEMEASTEAAAFTDSAGRSPQSRLDRTLDYILATHEDPEKCAWFWELWAMSTREPEAKQAMKTFYRSYCDGIQTLVKDVNPALTQRQACRRAALIVSMLEGLSLLRGAGKERGPYVDGIEREVRESIRAIVMR